MKPLDNQSAIKEHLMHVPLHRQAHRPDHWRGLQLTSLITRNITKKHLNDLWKPPTASKAETYISHLITQAKAQT